MFYLYNFLITLTSFIWAPWMLLRANRRREAPNWKERLGQLEIPSPAGRSRVWIHAVSVGEVIAAKPILQLLREQEPTLEIVLTVTTSSGHQTAREQAKGLFDYLFYFPIDVLRFQMAGMQRVRPRAVAIMETELWWNFLWSADIFEAPVILINGRISDRNFRRTSRLGPIYRPMLKLMRRCLMQTQADADRIRQLGAENVEVLGNCKFDQAAAAPSEAGLWREKLGLSDGKPVLVVGSARAEEFAIFAEALVPLAGEAQIIFAPRHLERLPEFVAVLPSTLAVAYRSRGETAPQGGILFLDTYGELADIYSVADLVVIGGGFANLGGQNLLQPLAAGKPVIHGPHMQNFRDVAQLADAAGAAELCTWPELLSVVQRLLTDPERRAQMGGVARQLILDNVGASQRYADAILATVREGEALFEARQIRRKQRETREAK
jgi:3-deoxy-D-manno-octulosonic-acid transferase